VTGPDSGGCPCCDVTSGARWLFLDRLAATVVLRGVIALVEQAPGLPDDQLQARLAGLAEMARPGAAVADSRFTSIAPAGRRSSPAPVPGGQPVPAPRGQGDRVVSGKIRPPFDPWRDVEGTHIPVGARVEQVAVARGYGALSRRLHWRGEVLRRGHYTRLFIRFDGESEPVSIRPHLLRMVHS
jgi:hypothetical protein